MVKINYTVHKPCFFFTSTVGSRLVSQLGSCKFCNNKHGHVRICEEAGEMAQGLRAVVSFPDVVGSIPFSNCL